MEARILHLIKHSNRMHFVDAMRDQCSRSNVACAVLPGIDGTAQSRVSTLGFIDRGMQFPVWREFLTGGEVGCLRSHAAAWADNAGQPVLVLEDDMVLDPQALAILNEVTRPVASSESHPTIITLTWLTPRSMPKMQFLQDDAHVHRPTFGYGTGAYWCNAQALHALRAHCPGTKGHPLLPVDEYLPILANMHPDGRTPWLRSWALESISDVQLFTLVPGLATYGQNESTTHVHAVAPWLGYICTCPRLMGYWRMATIKGHNVKYLAFVFVAAVVVAGFLATRAFLLSRRRIQD